MGQLKNTKWRANFKPSGSGHNTKGGGGVGGVGRLIFTGNVETSLWNKYTPGSNVGGLNASVRRALKRRATAKQGTTIASNNSVIGGQRPCCPELQYNPSNLAHPYPQQGE